MDAAVGLAVETLLRDAKRIGDEVVASLPPALDEVDAEAAELLRAQLTLIERVIWLGAPAPVIAAEPVWQAAGAILVLDIEGAEILADRMEVIGDKIFRGVPQP